VPPEPVPQKEDDSLALIVSVYKYVECINSKHAPLLAAYLLMAIRYSHAVST
jgi:hypothetical protein